MKPLFSSLNMHAIDSHIISDLGTPGIELMETAADGVVSRAERFLSDHPGAETVIFCGPGNNGGDGLAVLRKLKEKGRPATGYLLADAEKYRGDAQLEYEAARAAECRMDPVSVAVIEEGALVIDALFGTGLARELTDAAEAAVKLINSSGAYRIAVDIPSGLNSDSGEIMGIAVSADETVTFQEMKTGILTQNGRKVCGEVILHRIHGAATEETPAAYLIEAEDIRALLPRRPVDSHKGMNGRALLLGGSAKYTGAVRLAALSALRAGTGLLTVGLPASVRPALYELAEVMTVPLGEGGCWDDNACSAAVGLIAGRDAVAIGPGMDTIASDEPFIRLFESGIPCVIDADGLNTIARRRYLLGKLSKRCVLTPHPAEMARLLGTGIGEVLRDMPGTAKRAAGELNAVVLLKGASSCISDGEKVYICTAGNPGLAKGGSGDTLTGIILAMLSQGLSPIDAACAGAYLMGTSAEKAMSILEERMLIASDVTASFPLAVSEIFHSI